MLTTCPRPLPLLCSAHYLPPSLAAWRLDEARLLWRAGHHKLAARTARSLAEAMQALQVHAAAAALPPGGAGGASTSRRQPPPAPAPGPGPAQPPALLLPPNPLQLASVLSLAGKWGGAAQLEDVGPSGPGAPGGAGPSAAGPAQAGGGGDGPEGVMGLLTASAQVGADASAGCVVVTEAEVWSLL